MDKQEKLDKCPMCGSDNVHYSESEHGLICKDCGHIFEELSEEDETKLEKASDVI